MAVEVCVAAPVIDPHDCLPAGELDFGAGVRLVSTPEWAQQAIRAVFPMDTDLLMAKRCLYHYYEREFLGRPEDHLEATSALKGAMISLWLRHATPLYYRVALHAFQEDREHLVLFAAESDSIFKANERYGATKLTPEQLADVRIMHQNLRSVYLEARDGADHALGVALRFSARALAERWWQSRFLHLWICLEALFGSESEVSYRLALRTANFLGTDAHSREEVFRLIREGYKWRSRLAHGRPLDEKARERSSILMNATEGLLQSSLRRILLEQPELREIFGSVNRESYLDSLAFR